MWIVDPKHLERLRREQRRQPVEATLQLPLPQPPPPKQEPPAEDEPQRGVIVIDL